MPESTERGALTEAVFYILLALFEPRHGYGIMQFAKEISNDRVNLGPGTLYGALNTLQEKGWIEALDTGDNRKKEYQLTLAGIQTAEAELERLQELITNGKKIIRGIT